MTVIFITSLILLVAGTGSVLLADSADRNYKNLLELRPVFPTPEYLRLVRGFKKLRTLLYTLTGIAWAASIILGVIVALNT